MTAITDFECRGCTFMDDSERQFFTQQIDQWGTRIESSLSVISTKIDVLQNGHAELDKNQAVTSSELTNIKGSVARLGERMGKAEIALATNQGADQVVEKTQDRKLNWTAIIVGALVTIAGTIITVLLTEHGGK